MSTNFYGATEEYSFPNGFSNWYETFYEVVSYFHHDAANPVLIEKEEINGIGGMWLLAKELTDEFESLYIGKEWDGEWFDTLESFLEEKLRDERYK